MLLLRFSRATWRADLITDDVVVVAVVVVV